MKGIPEQGRGASRRAAARQRSAELRRVDAALDAIGVRGALSWGDDDDVPDRLEQDAALSLLLALRADIDDAIAAATTRPGAGLLDEGAEVVSLPRRRATRRGVAIAGVAAVVVSFGGVAAAAVTSAPGSALYGLHRVLTGAPADPGKSLRAVSELLDQAESAIADARFVAADALLTDAARRLDALGSADGVSDLQARLDQLRAALTAAKAAAEAGRGAPAAKGKAPSDQVTPQATQHRSEQAGTHGKPGGTTGRPENPGKSGQHSQAPSHGQGNGQGNGQGSGQPNGGQGSGQPNGGNAGGGGNGGGSADNGQAPTTHATRLPRGTDGTTGSTGTKVTTQPTDLKVAPANGR